jgi:excisionase family DNA binding protein
MTTTTRAKYVHVAVAARQLGLSAETVRMIFDRGELAGIRSETGYRLIDVDSLTSYRDRRPLTVSEAASRLGVSRETVTRRFDSGELAGHRTPAGHRMIDPAGL